MKKIILPILLLTIFSINSQVTIFEDDFESYTDFTITNFGNWTMHDIDLAPTWGVGETDFPHEGEAMTGIIFNPSECSTDVAFASNYSTETGSKYFTFWAVATSDTLNDDYLITPKIDLQNVTNPIITFFAKSLASTTSPDITPEEFEVLLSTTGNEVSDFTINLGGIESVQRQPGSHAWDEFTHDLSPYIGEDIYIAIHYISPNTSYALHFDDFKVEVTSVAAINDSKIVNFTYYPNPVKNVLNIKADDYIIEEITILNTLGQIILIKKGTDLENKINTADLKNGVYFVIIEGQNQKASFSFIKV